MTKPTLLTDIIDRTVTLSCLILELLAFVYFYTLNFVRDITLKL
jgi:hypothetical protein